MTTTATAAILEFLNEESTTRTSSNPNYREAARRKRARSMEAALRAVVDYAETMRVFSDPMSGRHSDKLLDAMAVALDVAEQPEDSRVHRCTAHPDASSTSKVDGSWSCDICGEPCATCGGGEHGPGRGGGANRCMIQT